MRLRQPLIVRLAALRAAGNVPGRRRAVTLVELVVAMLLIGILAAVAAPRYVQTLSQHRVEAAARRIVLDLELARRQAEMTSTDLIVSFDTLSEQYQLAGVDRLDRRAGDYTVHLGGETYGSDLVSVDLGGDAQIVFSGYGLPDSGGTVVVQSGGVQRAVVVDAQTGKAQVQ